MVKPDGKPTEETLSGMVDQLKRDALSWATAEQALLSARVKSGMKRLELAAILMIAVLMLAIAGSVTLANVLVLSLSGSLGPTMAGLVVSIALLLAGLALIFWIRSLLRPGEFKGRAQSAAKVIWSALNESN